MDVKKLPKTREEALENNIIYYFTEKPCNHGHVAAQYVINNRCVECHRISDKKRTEARRCRTEEEIKFIRSSKISKICAVCKIEQPVENYSFNITTKDGFNSRCKDCCNLSEKDRRDKRSARTNEELSLISKDILLKKCYNCSEEKTIENFFKDRSSKDGYRNLCKDCSVDYHQDYKKLRRSEDPHFRLDENISNQIYQALRGNKNGRKWESIVGYTKDELHSHFASLFTEGMDWNNYGYGEDKWNLGHRIPRCSFYYENVTDDQVKECWSLKNLFPQWQPANMEKIKEDRKLSIRNRNKKS